MVHGWEGKPHPYIGETIRDMLSFGHNILFYKGNFYVLQVEIHLKQGLIHPLLFHIKITILGAKTWDR